MNSNSVTFLQEFRATVTMRGSEPSEQGVEMRMTMSESTRFAVDRQPVDGDTELHYRIIADSAQMTMTGRGPGGGEIDTELMSISRNGKKPHEARVVESIDDFGNLINGRCRMLLIGLEMHLPAIGLVPPLWSVGLPDLQRWLTAEEQCMVSIHERVEYIRESDDSPTGTSIEPADVGLDFQLRILSAARQSPDAGGGYEVTWRVDAMKAEVVYIDPTGGINRLDDSGSSHGSATFDESGVLLSLSGTGTSQSTKDMNSKHKGIDGQPQPGPLTQVEDVELSVRRS